MSLVERYGKTALVTGASSGIGKAFAESLAEEGFDLVLVARRKNLLDEIKSRLEAEHGIRAFTVSKDLTVGGCGQEIGRFVEENGLQVDMLVNNAGFGSHGEFEQLDLQNELDMVRLNCMSFLEMTHAFLPGMKERKRGAVINVASVLSLFPGPFMATYSATKSFDLAYSNAMYGECKPYHVDVLALLPGTTDTNFFNAGHIDRLKQDFPKSTPRHAAEAALKALGKKPYVVDGLLNKVGVFFSRFLPAKFLIAMNRKILR